MLNLCTRMNRLMIYDDLDNKLILNLTTLQQVVEHILVSRQL